jgi:hypothetical protein
MVQQSTAVINAMAALLIWIAYSKVINIYPAINVTNNKMTIKEVLNLASIFIKIINISYKQNHIDL